MPRRLWCVSESIERPPTFNLRPCLNTAIKEHRAAVVLTQNAAASRKIATGEHLAKECLMNKLPLPPGIPATSDGGKKSQYRLECEHVLEVGG